MPHQTRPVRAPVARFDAARPASPGRSEVKDRLGPVSADEHRVLFYDLETTDCDPDTARIVQLAFVDDQGGVLLESRVHPGCPIPAASSAIHGLHDADVAAAPRFGELAPQVQRLIDGATLAGYNSRSFDAVVLDNELRRAGQPGIDLASVEEIDVYRIWMAAEPRSLIGAVRRFLGRDHAGAHDAKDDAEATRAVLGALTREFGLGPDDLLRLSKPPYEVDRDGKLRRSPDSGEVLLAFGPHRGEPALAHRGFLQWMLGRNFSAATKAAVRALLEADGGAG